MISSGATSASLPPLKPFKWNPNKRNREIGKRRKREGGRENQLNPHHLSIKSELGSYHLTPPPF